MEFYYHGVDKDILILSADGGLMSVTADQFVSELERFVELGCRKLIVDCTALTHISSSGIAILVTLHRRLAKQGGDVKLARVAGLVSNVIRLANLTQLFQIYPSVEAARAAFAGQDDGK